MPETTRFSLSMLFGRALNKKTGKNKRRRIYERYAYLTRLRASIIWSKDKINHNHTEMADKLGSSEELKELGNTAVKDQKFAEAIFHYTYAIKLDPTNYILFSNRSLAFLKEQQYYFALEDANETIKLSPTWPKGYFRKGEVEYATGYYMQACESYRKALELKPNDINIIEALNRTAKEILKEQKADETVPWLGAGIGIIIGVTIVIADCVFTYKPTHPMLMAFVTIAIAMIGYGIARLYRYWRKTRRNGLLEPPIDLNKSTTENSEDLADKEVRHSPRYTKSQARHRFKKGKL